MSEDISYTENTRAIINVGFGILSPERILALSVAEIYKPMPSSADEPLDGTLMDPRLGSNSKAELNKITDLDIKNDPGNFGHLKLAKPVIPQLKFHDQIIQTLKMTCYKCSNILLDKSDKELMADVRTRKSKARYKFVKDYITSQKTIHCYKCGVLQPHFFKGTNKNIVYQIVGIFSDDLEAKEKTFNQEIVYNILKNITDEDCMLIGYDPKIARPDWMLWTVMPIPPPTVRPSIKLENGQQAEDDLTVILNQIINTNVSLLRQLNNKKDNEKTIEEYWSLLQLNVAAYIDNEQSAIPPVTNRSNKPLRTLRSRIKAKKGRIRNNLMGKRVDYSARSVITPDPNISINELGVPMSVAMRLDYKEIVTEFNVTALTRLVHNGPDIWPGANKVKRLTSDKKKWTITNLAYVKNREGFKLRLGDVVYRHLQDGDWVLFNRQPSLHKSSMMAHQAKIMSQGETFRLNISVTTPYNADFDGDEMNMHVPRSYRTRIELEELASVPTQIVSPQGSSPQIGLVQDAMLGVFRSTVSDNYLTASQVMRLLAWTSTYNGMLPAPDGPNNTWTIRSIISTVLPEITLQYKSDDPLANVEIINGKFVSGSLNKESAGGKISKIVHRIWKDYGPETTRLFMDNMMNLMMQWLLIDGFSIGLIDVQIDNKTTKEVKDIVNKVYQEANRKISELKQGLMTVKFSGINVEEQFEFEMTKILEDAKNKARKITYESLSNKANRIYSTVTSGSKGTQMNVVQICSMLGQQVVDNQRIESGHRLRTSAHFPKYDLRPEAKGFIESNFLNGLNPAEYLMHAISGREGVISTAIRTGTTGYIQRKLVKTMEDLSVRYDGTVRNANGFIFQNSYGLDNFDGAKLERQKLDYFRMSDAAFQKTYGWTNEELKTHLTAKAYAELAKQVNFGQEHLQDELNRIWNDCFHVRRYLYQHKDTIDDMYSPVNFNAVFNRIKYRFNLEKKTQTDVSPLDVIMKVRALLLDLKLDQPHPLGWRDSQHFVLLLKSNLSSKKLLSVYHVNEAALDYILLRVKELYLDGLINPGEMVGTIAAQSIGEPSTQLTLDTFHQAGIGGAKSKRTEGTDRLKEIFSVTFYPKTPAMRIYINNNLLNITDKLTNEEAIHRVEVVVDKLQFTTLGNIVNEDGYEILYDPSDEKTVVVEDQAWLNEVREFREQTISTPWLIRFVLDSSKIQNISLHDVIANIENSRLVNERIDVVSNDVNAASVVIRVRVALRNDDPKKELKDLAIKLLSIQIKGFVGVNGGSVDNKDVDITLADGTVIPIDSPDYKKYKYKNEGKGTVESKAKTEDTTTNDSGKAKAVADDNGKAKAVDDNGKAKAVDDNAVGKAKKKTTARGQKGGGGSSSRGADIVEVKNKDDDKELNPSSQRYIIYTEGSNMYDVFSLKECDPEYTISNDIQEILRTLGIEAAREAIIYEILEIFKDKGVSNRHLGLLADVMTAQGYLISIDRYGVNKTDTGILSKGTFEETTKIFATSAIFGESDQVKGVSGNIMFGQMFHGGTKAFDVLLDEEMLMNEDVKLHYQDHRPRKDQVYEEVTTIQDDNEIDLGFEYKFN